MKRVLTILIGTLAWLAAFLLLGSMLWDTVMRWGDSEVRP